jgi:hypothetical protein
MLSLSIHFLPLGALKNEPSDRLPTLGVDHGVTPERCSSGIGSPMNGSLILVEGEIALVRSTSQIGESILGVS